MARALVILLLSVLMPVAAHAQKRAALVVGIDKYDNLGAQQQLQRAVADARSVGSTLRSLGFEVTTGENVGRGEFNALWQKFLDTLQPGDTAAFFYSGHGVEIEGANFLLPRDLPHISYGRQEQIKRESLSVSDFLHDLRGRKPQVTLVILDACRDHPLVPPEYRSLRSAAGLARMEATAGTFIMYSAGAGERALDRLPGNDPDPRNSVYTRKLLPLLSTPGLELPELARRLRSEVKALAALAPHNQNPAYYDGLDGKFCVAGCKGSAPAPSAAQSHASDAERSWHWVKDSTSQSTLEKFLRQYSDTPYGPMAQSRLDQLKKEKVAAASAPVRKPSSDQGKTGASSTASITPPASSCVNVGTPLANPVSVRDGTVLCSSNGRDEALIRRVTATAMSYTVNGKSHDCFRGTQCAFDWAGGPLLFSLRLQAGDNDVPTATLLPLGR